MISNEGKDTDMARSCPSNPPDIFKLISLKIIVTSLKSGYMKLSILISKDIAFSSGKDLKTKSNPFKFT